MIRPALVLLALLTLLTGVLYPLASTGLAQVAFPRQANGSRIGADGTWEAVADKQGTIDTSLSFTPLAGNTYYFRVRAHDAAARAAAGVSATTRARMSLIERTRAPTGTNTGWSGMMMPWAFLPGTSRAVRILTTPGSASAELISIESTSA